MRLPMPKEPRSNTHMFQVNGHKITQQVKHTPSPQKSQVLSSNRETLPKLHEKDSFSVMQSTSVSPTKTTTLYNNNNDLPGATIPRQMNKQKALPSLQVQRISLGLPQYSEESSNSKVAVQKQSNSVQHISTKIPSKKTAVVLPKIGHPTSKNSFYQEQLKVR